MEILSELVNLGNGSAALGDRLAADICREAIQEIERLRKQIDKMHTAGLGPDWTNKAIRELEAKVDRLEEENEQLKSEGPGTPRGRLAYMCKYAEKELTDGKVEPKSAAELLEDAGKTNILAGRKINLHIGREGE